jgi:hypothetical protein
MRNSTWTWTLIATAAVLFGSYRLMTHLGRSPTSGQITADRSTSSPSRGTQSIDKNPLLGADKLAVSRWFPGNCFAEIYMKNPSFGGKLVVGCITKVKEEVKAETGFALTDRDFKTPPVVAHFKEVFGSDGPWIH